MVTLVAGDVTKLRTGQHESAIYLSILVPDVILSALVNNLSIARGDRSIAYDTGTGSAADFAKIQAGQTLKVTTSDGDQLVRVKSISGNETSGTITVDENGIDWTNNDPIEIHHEYRFWPVPPRFDSSTFYKFYDTTYTDGNHFPPPVAIAGPHQAGFLSGGSLVFNIDASSSYAISNGASISSYLWESVGGTIASPSSASTTFTVTSAGSYWLKLTVTDSNAKTQSTFRCMFAHDTANMPYVDFAVTSFQGSWDSNGWSSGLTIYGDSTLSDIPDGALCCLWNVGKINNTEDYVNIWSAQSDNVLMNGYLRQDSGVNQLPDGSATITFTLKTPQAQMANRYLLGDVSLDTVTTTPTGWEFYASWASVGRYVHHLLKWHSTAFEVVDILGLTDDTRGTFYCEFSEPSLLEMVNQFAFERGIHAKLISNRAGQLYFSKDSQLLNDSERGALDNVFTMTLDDFGGNVTIVRFHEGRIGSVVLGGHRYDGSLDEDDFFMAIQPGYIDTISIPTPEFRGTGNITKDNQVLTDQTDCNERCGRVAAQANNPYGEFRTPHRGNYLGAFDIVPNQGWYLWGVTDADLKRQLSLNGSKLICRSVNARVDVQNGTITTNVNFEAEAFGPDGIPHTEYPKDYPAAPNPPSPAWTPPIKDLELGTPVVFDASPQNAFNNAISTLTTTKCIGVFNTIGTVKWFRAIIFEIAGSVITFGSDVNVEGGVLQKGDVDTFTSTKAICVYKSSGGNREGTAKILDVSGTVITVGAAAQYESGEADTNRVATLTTSKAIVSYIDIDDSGKLKACILDEAASVITPGTPTVIDSGSIYGNPDIANISTTHAVIFYRDTTNSDRPTAIAVSVSGTTITPGTGVVVTTSASDGNDNTSKISALSGTDLICTWVDQANGRVQAAILQVSGTTITPGTVFELSSETSPSRALRPAVVANGSSAAFLSYYSTETGNYRIKTLAISGTTITDNGDEIFFTGFSDPHAATLVDTDKSIMSYPASAGGTAIIADPP